MKLTVKQYKHVKEEIASKEIELPTEPAYYFETGIRRAIRISPVYTTWNKEVHNEEEELASLDFTLVYLSWECKVERLSISISELESIYYYGNHQHKDLIQAFVDGHFDKRSKERFNMDLKTALSKFVIEE